MKQGQMICHKEISKLDPQSHHHSRWNKKGGCEKHTQKTSGAKTGEYL